MKKISKSFLVTLFHAPIIFWFYLGIVIYRTNGEFSEPLNIVILSSMIILVFATSYFTKKINEHLYYSIWLVFLSIGIVMVFKNSWIALYLLFLSYIAFMIYPSKKEKKDNPISLDETQSFEDKSEILKNSIINKNFIKFDDKKTLELLEDIENCEILEINRLQNSIEFVYLKEGKKKYLSIKDRYFFSSMGGVGMYFEFFDSPLDDIEIDFTKTTYKKEKHTKLSDIKKIQKIYYSEFHEVYYREGKVEIIYENKDNHTNSCKLHFIEDEEGEILLSIKKYENDNIKLAVDNQMDLDKTISRGLSNKLINKLTSVKVLSIKKVQNGIEIEYEDESKISYLIILYTISFDSIYKCKFTFENKISDEKNKQNYNELEDIAYIHNITYDVDYYVKKDFNTKVEYERLGITANTKDNTLKEYTLTFDSDKNDNRYFKITTEPIKNYFISKVFDGNRVFSFSYSKDIVSCNDITIEKNEKYGKSKSYRPYYTESLKENSKSIIELNQTNEHFYISGIGWKGSFGLLSKEEYNKFDEADKKSFINVAIDCVEYLNSLFVNKTFKNAYSLEFEGYDKYKAFMNSFGKKGYKIEEIYNNAEYPRPASKEIFKVSKEDEILKLVVFNDWLDSYEINIEYDKKVD